MGMNKTFYVIIIKGGYTPWAATRTWEEAIDLVKKFMQLDKEHTGFTSVYDIFMCESKSCEHITAEVFGHEKL